MSSPNVSVHEMAQRKQVRRRDAALPSSTTTTTDVLTALEQTGQQLLPGLGNNAKNYDTVAIGFLADASPWWPHPKAVPRIIVAFKGIANPPSAQVIWGAAANHFPSTQIYEVITLVDHVSDAALDEGAHLHGEMAIVQFVVNQLGVPKNQLGAAGLQIACIGKGVCPDCSGWMFRHGIPHSKTRDTVASTGWTHPLSGAFYKYKGPALQYFKPAAGIQDTSTAKATPYRGNTAL